MASCQKLGIILENKVIWKLMLSKNVLLNSYSSMKKSHKDWNDFWCRKLTLKVRFRHFLTPPHYTNLQNSMISFDYSWFFTQNLSNFVSLLENSTTDIAIIKKLSIFSKFGQLSHYSIKYMMHFVVKVIYVERYRVIKSQLKNTILIMGCVIFKLSFK